MEHEELKKLYEIDKKHSDTPWEFWEAFGGEEWFTLSSPPGWYDHIFYRRKPDAPVWTDDKEDARKWMELVAFCENGPRTDEAIANKVDALINPQPDLIQGYTREQWQRIIDEGFLCEFSRNGVFWGSIGCLGKFDDEALRVEGKAFSLKGHNLFEHCRPLRIKGVRQPWFGGECPVNGDVLVRCRSGLVRLTTGLMSSGWQHLGTDGDIIEFIEL